MYRDIGRIMNTKRLTWYTSECIMYRDAAIIPNIWCLGGAGGLRGDK